MLLFVVHRLNSNDVLDNSIRAHLLYMCGYSVIIYLHMFLLNIVIDREHVFYFVLVVGLSFAIHDIPVINGSNFKSWKEHVKIVLGCFDLDYALRLDHHETH